MASVSYRASRVAFLNYWISPIPFQDQCWTIILNSLVSSLLPAIIHSVISICRSTFIYFLSFFLVDCSQKGSVGAPHAWLPRGSMQWKQGTAICCRLETTLYLETFHSSRRFLEGFPKALFEKVLKEACLLCMGGSEIKLLDQTQIKTVIYCFLNSTWIVEGHNFIHQKCMEWWKKPVYTVLKG